MGTQVQAAPLTTKAAETPETELPVDEPISDSGESIEE